MTELALVLLWNLILYWIHRAVHVVPILRDVHWDHHQQVLDDAVWGWHWSNLLLFNETWRSTLDLWITEVIPTLVFCAIFGCWWLAAAYYVWAAFIQEWIEHNKDVDIYPWLTGGKWHLVHHQNEGVNFGLFIPVWDFLFGTYQRHGASKDARERAGGASKGARNRAYAKVDRA